MLYITGDIHGDLMWFMPIMTEQDYVMVRGDFGIPWWRYPDEEGKLLQSQPISYKEQEAKAAGEAACILP